MLVNLVPDFLASLETANPIAAYHDYLDRHRPVLAAYWHNYVLDLDGPHAEQVIERTVKAQRRDLQALLDKVDVQAIADEALNAALANLVADHPIDL